MPVISRFYGIVISMKTHDHPPPHFHVKYAEHQCAVSIATCLIIDGSIPDRAYRLVQEWRELHRREFEENWSRFEAELSLLPIDPI